MKPIFNRAPLTPNTLSPLPLGSIRPEGWLLEQISAQAKGITRQFAAVCPEIGANGEWMKAEDGEYARIDLINTYTLEDSFGYTVPGANETIEITFTVSGW